MLKCQGGLCNQIRQGAAIYIPGWMFTRRRLGFTQGLLDKEAIHTVLGSHALLPPWDAKIC